MAKPKLGTKRVCPACGTKYYDLHKSPITCPNCGTIFVIAAAKAAPARAAAPVVEEQEVEIEPAAEQDAELVSLEDVEDDADADIGPDADEEEAVIPDAEALEVEEEAIEPDEAAPFLVEEEEEGDDVAGLLDVDAEEEDER